MTLISSTFQPGRKAPPPVSVQPVGPVPLRHIVAPGALEVTPALAARILEEARFDGQRPLGRPNLDKHVMAMRRGSFDPDYQIWFVRVGDRLYLTDGQHRLSAIMETGGRARFTVMIVDGETMEDVRRNYHRHDRLGRRRTDSEVLNSAGVAEDQVVSRITSLAMFHAANLLASGFGKRGRYATQVLPTDDEKIEFLARWWEHARVYESLVQNASTELKRKLFNPGVLAVGVYTLRYQPLKASEFWRTLADNDGLRRGDARHSLVNFLLTSNLKTQGGDGEIAASAAWNYFFEGREVKLLRGSATISILGTPLAKRRGA